MKLIKINANLMLNVILHFSNKFNLITLLNIVAISIHNHMDDCIYIAEE